MAWIAGERIILRAWERDDVRSRWEADQSADSEAQRLRDWHEPPRSLTRREQDFDAEQAEPDPTAISLIIEAEGRAVGDINLFQIDTRDARALIGLSIWSRDDWDKGYGTDATRAMMRWGFEQMHLNRIELEVAVDNPRAIHVYEKKLGFVREGLRREQHFDDGAYHDALIMGILAREFAAGGCGSR